MKPFGFFRNKKNDTFRISEDDKGWVEHNLEWLIQTFGYPTRNYDQFLLTEIHFIATFRAEKVYIDNIIEDVCALLEMPDNVISFELVNDLRDIHGMPLVTIGDSVDIEFEVNDGKYHMYIANSLQNNPRRLIYRMVHECIEIKLISMNLEFDDGDDTDLFIYLAGIYFGFGVILANSLIDAGISNDGTWETSWNYRSPMPDETMIFGLATFTKLIEQDAPEWKHGLTLDMKGLFEKAITYLTENPSRLYDPNELEANDLFTRAIDRYVKNEFHEGIAMLEEVLFLTKLDQMKAIVFNEIGYYNLRLKNYEKSLTYFEKSIQIRPEFGYPMDNLGYALIQLGQIEEGREWLEQAMNTANNELAYSYRNLALYHQAKGDVDEAADCFQRAFDSMLGNVDLLEYHFANFLIENGELEKGLDMLKLGVEKGEPEAIERMKDF